MRKKRKRGQEAIRIGLTGSLASGKTTALKFFKKRGWKALSADAVVAEIYREKGIRKKDLRKKYNARKKLKALEAWVHPLVGKRILKWMKRQKKPMIVEVPLLFEAGFQKFFDRTVFVDCKSRDRIKRVLKRGMPLEVFRALDANQLKASKKRKMADYILKNSTKASLKKQVKKWSAKLAGI